MGDISDSHLERLDGDEECEHCGGGGFFGHDCGEDTCCCLRPEDNVPCPYCGGTEEVLNG